MICVIVFMYSETRFHLDPILNEQSPHSPTLNGVYGLWRGCAKMCFLVPVKPIHILCMDSFRYCPSIIENVALTGFEYRYPIHIQGANSAKS